MGVSTRQAPQSIPEGPFKLPPRPGNTSGAGAIEARDPSRRSRPEQEVGPALGWRLGGVELSHFLPRSAFNRGKKFARHVCGGGGGCFPQSSGQDP